MGEEVNLLATFAPDLIKIDMELIRGIEGSKVRQTIVSCVAAMARTLGITVIAEGIETADELTGLKGAGITLFQGYPFAKPMVAALPSVRFPGEAEVDFGRHRTGMR